MSIIQSVSTRYSSRGVSSTKEDVHKSISNIDKGLFPKAFCKIYPDYLTGDENYCLVSHADGAGTKSVLAYLYWKETGDISIWKNISQDSIVMNLDDLICVGSVDNFCYTSNIGRNKNLIPGEVVSTLINSTTEFFDTLQDCKIHLMGGETADLGDVVRTCIVDGVMTTRLKRSEVIDNGNIRPGDLIIGFSSSGQTTYEKEYNSGISSNGITSARHDVLNKIYESFVECFDPLVKSEYRFQGSFKLIDVEEETGIQIGKLLLSPTRTYLPVVKKIFEQVDRKSIHGMIHCTGGGQTKILHFIDNLHIIKDDLFDVPPIFKLIQRESNSDLKEMYQVFNMGHRLEMYIDPNIANDIINISKEFNLEAKVIGRVEESNCKRLTILTNGVKLEY